MKKLHLLLLIMFSLILLTQGWSAEKIALTTKARGTVSLKRSGETKFKPNVKLGKLIFNNDHLKTGKDGYAALVFIDDKSQIKIWENSEMIVSRSSVKKTISKRISMQMGTLKAEVSPQRKGEFVIATPTSVASVKGTTFWAIIDPVLGDIFYGISGEVEVKNNESDAVIVVGANETGTSTPDGQVNVEQTLEGSVPVDEEDQGGEDSNILKIQMRNKQGDVKDIIIEYK
jgi:hypothetical protein